MSPVAATSPVTHEIRSSLPWAEWRAFLLACLAGYSTFDPNFALRNGALVCGIILLTLINRVRFRAADVFAVVLTAWTALSLVWAVDQQVTTLSLTNQLAVLTIFLTVRSAIANSKQLQIVALGYLGGCLYALYLLNTQNAGANFNEGLSANRLGIAGVNYNYMAYSLATGLALVVLLWHIFRTRLRMRFLLSLTVPLFVFGIAQNGTRGALIGAALVLLWVGLRRISPRVGLSIPVASLSLAAFATFTGLSDGALRQLDGMTSRSTGDLAGRLTIWPYARESIGLHPFIGVGGGGFQSINPLGIGAHNVPLQIASGLGLIGLALFIAATYCALMTETRNVEPATRGLLVGVMIAATGPIMLSGHWELSPAAWFGLALFSRIGVLPPTLSQISSHLWRYRPQPHSAQPVSTPG